MSHIVSEPLQPVAVDQDLDIDSLLHFRGIMHLALPLMIGSGISAIQHFLDRIFLGYINPEALASSFPAMMTHWVITCLFVQVAMYLSTFVSQHSGAKEHQLIGAMFWPAFLLTLLGGFVSLACIPLLPWVASCFAAEAEVEKNIANLCRWYCYSSLPLLLAVLWGSFFAALGRVRLVMVFSCLAVALNIFFNYVLMFGELGFQN